MIWIRKSEEGFETLFVIEMVKKICWSSMMRNWIRHCAWLWILMEGLRQL